MGGTQHPNKEAVLTVSTPSMLTYCTFNFLYTTWKFLHFTCSAAGSVSQASVTVLFSVQLLDTIPDISILLTLLLLFSLRFY